jgi:hypothetical protein
MVGCGRQQQRARHPGSSYPAWDDARHLVAHGLVARVWKEAGGERRSIASIATSLQCPLAHAPNTPCFRPTPRPRSPCLAAMSCTCGRARRQSPLPQALRRSRPPAGALSHIGCSVGLCVGVRPRGCLGGRRSCRRRCALWWSQGVE